MRVVINKCYGGFGLSTEASRMFAKRKGHELTFYKQTKYKHEGGRAEFQRCDPAPHDFYHAFTRDLGETISKLPTDCYWYPTIDRSDPDLLAVVDQLGLERAAGAHAKLSIVEVPDGIEFEIEDYDGQESIHEAHRAWY